MKKLGKIWRNYFLIFLFGILGLSLCGRTYSRYFNTLINLSDLPLAPWNVKINNQKVNSAGTVIVLVDPIITEVTTLTKTYKDKIVPGCKGYFDVLIDPTGTGVAVDYIIDFNSERLPGGMMFVQYATLDENKSIVTLYDSFPSDAKLTGTMPLVKDKVLGKENILRYRIYFDYVDDDSLNITAPNVDEQNSVMIEVILKQAI